MSGMRLLEGEVQQDDRADLQRTIDDLRDELAVARAESTAAKRQAARAVAELQRQLLPLYRALQAVFGEIEAVGVGSDPDTATSSDTPNPRHAAIWASWKSRLGPQCAKIIDALLLQPGMNTTQLAIAIGTHRNNIPNLIFKLNKAGLLNKNGGHFSLKELGA